MCLVLILVQRNDSLTTLMYRCLKLNVNLMMRKQKTLRLVLFFLCCESLADTAFKNALEKGQVISSPSQLPQTLIIGSFELDLNIMF